MKKLTTLALLAGLALATAAFADDSKMSDGKMDSTTSTSKKTAKKAKKTKSTDKMSSTTDKMQKTDKM